MPTQYKLMMTGDQVGGHDVTITVGIFPATSDPTQRNPDGTFVTPPVDSFTVAGHIEDASEQWIAKTQDGFNYWCQFGATRRAAAAALATNSTLVLDVTDPTT